MKDSPQVPSCDIPFEVPEPTGGKVKLEEVGYWKCILGGALFSTPPIPLSTSHRPWGEPLCTIPHRDAHAQAVEVWGLWTTGLRWILFSSFFSQVFATAMKNWPWVVGICWTECRVCNSGSHGLHLLPAWYFISPLWKTCISPANKIELGSVSRHLRYCSKPHFSTVPFKSRCMSSYYIFLLASRLYGFLWILKKLISSLFSHNQQCIAVHMREQGLWGQ